MPQNLNFPSIRSKRGKSWYFVFVESLHWSRQENFLGSLKKNYPPQKLKKTNHIFVILEQFFTLFEKLIKCTSWPPTWYWQIYVTQIWLVMVIIIVKLCVHFCVCVSVCPKVWENGHRLTLKSLFTHHHHQETFFGL